MQHPCWQYLYATNNNKHLVSVNLSKDMQRVNKSSTTLKQDFLNKQPVQDCSVSNVRKLSLSVEYLLFWMFVHKIE